MTAKHCKTKTCTGVVRSERFVYCRACRAKRAARWKSYLARHPELKRRRNRKYVQRRSQQQTPVAKAYRARHRAGRLRACKAWVAAHPEAKRRSADLNYAVRTGRVVKPAACQDCRQAKKPIVAWRDEQGDVTAWCCWACWHKRRRGE